MKYLVMECHLSYAVVLDEEGRFLKVANLHYEVGQTVTDVIEMQVPQSVAPKKNTKRWIYSIAAIAACLMLVLLSVHQMGRMIYASVYMTINPEIRIDVNRKDAVIGLEGINADGRELIEGYSYKNKDLNLVMDQLVKRAIDMGYLHEGGQISLVLDADREEWIVSHSDALTTHLNEHLKEIMSVTIKVTDKNAKNHRVVIPVAPAENHNGESDYTEEDDYAEESDYIETEMTTQPPVSTASDDSSHSDNNHGDNNSDYGQTDYDDRDDVEDDDRSDNDAISDGESDYNNGHDTEDDDQDDENEDEEGSDDSDDDDYDDDDYDDDDSDDD